MYDVEQLRTVRHVQACESLVTDQCYPGMNGNGHRPNVGKQSVHGWYRLPHRPNYDEQLITVRHSSVTHRCTLANSVHTVRQVYPSREAVLVGAVRY